MWTLIGAVLAFLVMTWALVRLARATQPAAPPRLPDWHDVQDAIGDATARGESP